MAYSESLKVNSIPYKKISFEMTRNTNTKISIIIEVNRFNNFFQPF